MMTGPRVWPWRWGAGKSRVSHSRFVQKVDLTGHAAPPDVTEIKKSGMSSGFQAEQLEG